MGLHSLTGCVCVPVPLAYFLHSPLYMLLPLAATCVCVATRLRVACQSN